MDKLTVEELDLMTFFECEPKMADNDVPWHYNDSVYVYSSRGDSVSFAIAPAYKDVRLIFSGTQGAHFEFNAMSVADVRYRSDAGREYLEVILSKTFSMTLCLKPTIRIIQNYKGELV